MVSLIGNGITLEESLRQFADLIQPHLLKLFLSQLIFLRVFPVIGAGEDIQPTEILGIITMSSMQEISNPSIPVIVELLEHVSSLPVLAQCVIEGVKSHEFQVLQGPVIGHRRHEKISCCVLDSELSSVSDVDADCVSKAKQDRS